MTAAGSWHFCTYCCRALIPQTGLGFFFFKKKKNCLDGDFRRYECVAQERVSARLRNQIHSDLRRLLRPVSRSG